MNISLCIEHLGYANERLAPEVHMSEVEYNEAVKRLRYQTHQTEGSTVYWASDEATGLVDFVWHNPDNETGYGGSLFRLPLKGSRRIAKVRGPWSSRCGQVNRFFPHSIEARIMVNGVQRSGSILISKLPAWANHYVRVRKDIGVGAPRRHPDIAYEVVRSSKPKWVVA